jgi:hypothetical protein
MATKYSNKTGDIHAPVEDVEVPGGIKLLVLVMAVVVVAAAVSVSLILQAEGLMTNLLFRLPVP